VPATARALALHPGHAVKRTILYVAGQVPYPPDSGLKIRQFHLLSAYAAVGEVRLVCFARDAAEMHAAQALADRCASIETVPVGTRQLESVLAPMPRWRRRLAEFASLTSSLVRPYESPAMVEAVRAATADADLVHVARLWMTAALRPLPGARRARPRLVLDLDDVETVVALRRARQRRGIPAIAAYWEWARLCLDQARALRAFDRVLVCSAEDRRKLGRRHVVVVPNGAPRPAAPRQPALDGNGTLLFCGTLGWEQNVDAVVFFVREILPLVRAVRSDVRLLVVGKNPAPAVRALHDGRMVTVVADVPSVEPYYREAAGMVVPIRVAGGTRIKILEAFAVGTPVVSTTVGCEGLEVVAGEHLLIGDTPRAFADRCLELLADGELRARLASRAAALAETRYSWPAIERSMTRMARELLDDPERIDRSCATPRAA
jgi:glycosyltransferase involved in cell wall biosynthesis